MDKSPRPSGVSELLQRCIQADEEAWTTFIDRYHRRIGLYVLRARGVGGVQTDGDGLALADLTQEVYLRLLANDCRALRDFRGETEPALLAYLAQIASTVVADGVRRLHSKKRTVDMVDLDGQNGAARSLADLAEAPIATSPDAVFQERYTPEHVHRLLRSIGQSRNDVRDAVVFLLHALDGLTAPEIARVSGLNLSSANVKTIIRRTRDRLQQAIHSEGSPT